MRPSNRLSNRRRDIHGVEDVVGAFSRTNGLRQGVGDHESFYREGLEGSHGGGGEKTCMNERSGKVSTRKEERERIAE